MKTKGIGQQLIRNVSLFCRGMQKGMEFKIRNVRGFFYNYL